MGLIRNDLQNENNDVPKKRLKYNGLRIFAFFFSTNHYENPVNFSYIITLNKSRFLSTNKQEILRF